MEIKEAKFVMSNSTYTACPNVPLVEVAFIGRSNVGKSSLINMLCNNKKLAKTSGTPGKTQLINHFLINENWHLVDLPGYGYAKVSKKLRAEFHKMINDYLEKREQLVNTFVLIDSRLPPQQIDLDFLCYLGEQEIPFSIIFTKIDKLKPQELKKNVAAFEDKMFQFWEELPPRFLTSAEKKTGQKEVLNYIGDILDVHN
ncbi:MAG: GTP-binding protein [Saprospiraceae bacterium]|jgi:GTP-binding protein